MLTGMPVRKTRGGRPATTSHDEIAAAAVQLFKERGYAATSVADIAAAVNVARRTYFSYFATKAEAFWWGDEKDLREVEQRLLELGPEDGHPLEQIIEIALLTSRRTHPTKEEARVATRMIESNPELQVGALRNHQRWTALISEHLRRHIGDVRNDLLPEVIAASLMAVGQTVLARWAESDGDEPLQDLLRSNLELLRAAFEETVADNLLD